MQAGSHESLSTASQRVMERLAEGLRRHPELLEQYIAISDRLQEVEVVPARMDVPEVVSPPIPATRRTRERLKMSAIKLLLERRIELVEKILEARADRLWDECMERKPWLLQPIESWLLEKHTRARQERHDVSRGYMSDSEIHGDARKEDRWKVRNYFEVYQSFLFIFIIVVNTRIFIFTFFIFNLSFYLPIL